MIRAQIPPQVTTVVDRFTTLMDDRLPGRLEGLYLRGSLAFGEWCPPHSDIDFTAVLPRRLTLAEVGVLQDVHAEVASAYGKFDGIHVTWADLAAGPDLTPDVPCVQGGWFHDEARIDVNPVAWHEVAERGIVVRGPGSPDIWTDSAALRAFTLRTLREYWQPEVDGLRRFPSEAERPDLLAWYVLGVPRLAHLLDTGALTSKSQAGRWAIQRYGPQWAPLLTAALDHREGRAVRVPDAAGDLVVAFVDLVVAAARRDHQG